MAGHLDFNTGKWVDDPQEAGADEPRSVDVGNDGMVRPSKTAAPAAMAPAVSMADSSPAPVQSPDRQVVVGDDGLVRPGNPSAPAALANPLSPVEKAKLVQFIGSGKGNAAAVSAARSMLTASGVPMSEVPADKQVTSQPTVPPSGNDPSSANLSPGQRAVILRARMRGQQTGAPLAMNSGAPGRGVE